MSQPDLIERYGASHFTLDSISDRRRVRSLAMLRRYQATLTVPLEEAGDTELRQYLVSLMADGMLASAANFHLRAITPFYAWLWRERVIDAEHLLRIRDVKPPRGANDYTPKPYSRKELQQFWAELDKRWPRLRPPTLPDGRPDGRHPIERYRKGTCSFRPIRKHVMRVQVELMVELALVAGMRKLEIYSLTVDDIHPDNEYLVVHGKRHNQHDKVREVPYSESTRALVREWFRLRAYVGATDDSPWMSVTGVNPTGPLYWNRMSSLLHFGSRWRWHRFRHTCATERLRAGMELHELQRFLGHSRLEQTLAYAKLVREDIHQAAARTDDVFQRAIRPAA